MFTLIYEHCDSCLETHPFFEYGTGERNHELCEEWYFETIYESLGD
jgi:hypothetical protein